MITLHEGGMPFISGKPAPGARVDGTSARRGTMAHAILNAHDTAGGGDVLRLRFDALASHDITYVGIVQTARASGLERFPVPYALTNCHNSLCAVGGTINEDDHAFGLSAARKYGGIYVPAHLAVIHQYARERLAACGGMVLGSDSHTRYGALGAMGVGEGGPELVKQLLGHTYDVERPEVVGVYLTGRLHSGVGPQDAALALIKAVFGNGFVKNRVLEFVGPGVAALSADERMGIDVMTTETACLSSIWQTDGVIEAYYAAHGRPEAFRLLAPMAEAYYDRFITLELDKIKPMIALPFHPSNAWTIEEFLSNACDILAGVEKEAASMMDAPPSLINKFREGALFADQGVIGGCAGGTYENVMWAAHALKGRAIGAGAYSLSVYPASQPVYMALMRAGALESLMAAGAVLRTAFCGPCFGAGDVPANGALSLRHTTRNFPSREGSKPQSGQLAYVALMDARSIAATALSGGRLTAADTLDAPPYAPPPYVYDERAYRSRVYDGFGKPASDEALVLGPGIADWPPMERLRDTLVMSVCAAIYDPVTTTDELIPSGETSSYRSNPYKLAEFTLSRKDPGYVARAKGIDRAALLKAAGCADGDGVTTGSCVFALRPGDGSAREQAASCQRVLGGVANIAGEYATKRYRSNVINWGMLPFTLEDAARSGIAVGDAVRVDGVRDALIQGRTELPATLIKHGGARTGITLKLHRLTDEERDIILDGCLINYYRR